MTTTMGATRAAARQQQQQRRGRRRGGGGKKETGGNETKTKTIPLSPPPTYPATLLKPKRKTGKEIYDGIPKYIRDKIINPEVLINWKPGEEENGEELPEPE